MNEVAKPRVILESALREMRAVRDGQPLGEVRSLLNESCDRLDVAISKMSDDSVLAERYSRTFVATESAIAAIEKARGEVTNSLPDEPSKGSAGEG